MPGATVNHASTKVDGDALLTSGGRVLGVCARAATLADAVAQAYRGVDRIAFEGMHYRTDIGADTQLKLGEGTAGE